MQWLTTTVYDFLSRFFLAVAGPALHAATVLILFLVPAFDVITAFASGSGTAIPQAASTGLPVVVCSWLISRLQTTIQITRHYQHYLIFLLAAELGYWCGGLIAADTTSVLRDFILSGVGSVLVMLRWKARDGERDATAGLLSGILTALAFGH